MLNQAETTAQNRSPKLFGENALLSLQIDGASEPLVINPPRITALGRNLKPSHSEVVSIDFSRYQGQDKGVSRSHAFLYRSRDTLAITDAQSTNGTFVNEQRLPVGGTQVLQNGDVIRLGTLAIRITFTRLSL